MNPTKMIIIGFAGPSTLTAAAVTHACTEYGFDSTKISMKHAQENIDLLIENGAAGIVSSVRNDIEAARIRANGGTIIHLYKQDSEFGEDISPVRVAPWIDLKIEIDRTNFDIFFKIEAAIDSYIKLNQQASATLKP